MLRQPEMLQGKHAPALQPCTTEARESFAADLIATTISTYSIFFCNLKDTLMNYKQLAHFKMA